MLLRRLFLAAVAIAPTFALAQADQATLDRIIDEGKNHSQVINHERYIAERIGARLTGSYNLDKAYEWAQKRMKDFGCKNVHLEQWGEWPVGFQRHPSVGRMVSPVARDFEFTTPSWSEGTHGKKRALAIYAPKTMDEFNAQKDNLRGKWVVFKTAPPRPPRVRRGETPTPLTPEQQAELDLRKSVSEAGILGTVMPARSGGFGRNPRPDQGELVVTSGNYRDKTYENHPMDVNITIRQSDMDAITKAMDAGQPVQLEFDVNQEFIKGPRKLFNVVGEIPGTEKPDEVVIVGGHLDSWDGPGSEGAIDNGTGSSCALEVARILNKVGAKPKRTVRIILFTGEEEGLFGSRGYVDMHKNEMSKIDAVFIEDDGTNWESGTYALESQMPALQPILDINNKIFPDMPMELRKVDRMPQGGGSDHVPFNNVGVPAFFWDKKGTADYTFIHHTQHDRFEYVIPKYLIQCATNEAIAAYITACTPDMMPREQVAGNPKN